MPQLLVEGNLQHPDIVEHRNRTTTVPDTRPNSCARRTLEIAPYTPRPHDYEVLHDGLGEPSDLVTLATRLLSARHETTYTSDRAI